MALWTAFTLGLLGSFHCVGMCGPIALSIPGNRNTTRQMVWNGLLYNSGRVFTYSLLGFVLGIFGMGATLAGYQEILSIVLGASIIIFALLPKLKKVSFFSTLYTRFSRRISRQIGDLYKEKTSGSSFLIGTLNGLLPCGFVVTGLAAALITDTVYHSMAYMALFGLGTLPAMFLLNLSPALLTPKTRSKLRPFSTYFAVFLGLILIARGFMAPGHMHFPV